jgi:hypothetical protein
MEQFQIVRAIFQPQDSDTLKETSRRWVGWEGDWEALWLIEEGRYCSQWAMRPQHDASDDGPPFEWAPLCDLAIVG